VSGEDAGLAVHQDRVGEAELLHAESNLLNLSGAVGAGVVFIGNQSLHRRVLYGGGERGMVR
jgi:hypothetical protein